MVITELHLVLLLIASFTAGLGIGFVIGIFDGIRQTKKQIGKWI